MQVCEWTGGAALEPLAPLVRHPRPTPLLTVGFALTKGDQPEWAVQRLTEAGADRVVVLMSARCVARWPTAKQERQLDRLREVARQAAMQSRRAWLPEVEGPVPFADLVPGGPGQQPHRWRWPSREALPSACRRPPCWWARRADGRTRS